MQGDKPCSVCVVADPAERVPCYARWQTLFSLCFSRGRGGGGTLPHKGITPKMCLLCFYPNKQCPNLVAHARWQTLFSPCFSWCSRAASAAAPRVFGSWSFAWPTTTLPSVCSPSAAPPPRLLLCWSSSFCSASRGTSMTSWRNGRQVRHGHSVLGASPLVVLLLSCCRFSSSSFFFFFLDVYPRFPVSGPFALLSLFFLFFCIVCVLMRVWVCVCACVCVCIHVVCIEFWQICICRECVSA